jgi:hypothetical protein
MTGFKQCDAVVGRHNTFVNSGQNAHMGGLVCPLCQNKEEEV